LPDIIQFKNGNQIKNTYDADGHKLGTEYFTWRPGANAPVVNAGDLLNLSYSQASTDQNGTAYIGNFEYNTLNGNTSLTTLSRIYNDEGYVENPADPQYYYFRHDHLGDNREVWCANSNTVAQRTQYYPSGLPFAYDRTVDHPDLQHRKYNGKEFVEMHGYDTYDFDHRGFYPAADVFTTRDWKAEETPDVSPYSYACDNPVRYRDENGDGPKDKILGFAAAVIDNAFGGITSTREIAAKYVTDAKDFNKGQDVGDAASIALWAAEFTGGQGIESGGAAVVTASLVAEVPSGGTSTVTLAGGAVAIGSGELMKAQGAMVMAVSTSNLTSQKGRITDNSEGTRSKNRLPDKAEPNTVEKNKPGTSMKKYGPDGNVQKEFNKGHTGEKVPKNEKNNHIHDYKPNPNNPSGRGDRQPGRPVKKHELKKDFNHE